MYTSTKALILSKTFWLGLITVLIGLLTAFQQAFGIYLDAKTVGLVAAFIGFLTIFLRIYTTQPIGGFVSTESFDTPMEK